MTAFAQRPLRKWQVEAIDAWKAAGRRGIASVVTGGGKTFFALQCIQAFQRVEPGATVLVVVPTEALLDQWFEEIVSFFDMPPRFINLLSARRPIKRGRINIGVLNTTARLAKQEGNPPLFLIVDECHKAASPVFRSVLNLPAIATLGLSATPERQYDDYFQQVLVPALGPVIYHYTYIEAMKDGVIVPFKLSNVLFNFTEHEKTEYQRLTHAIQGSIRKSGLDSDRTVHLLLRRARFSNSCPARVKIALKLIAKHRCNRILVFHEDISSCDILFRVLQANGVKAGIYHSKMSLLKRVETLRDYRSGKLTVLVSCRALDEGFNVPDTEVAVVAASTATYRQRIQRLGRVLRPADGKTGATIYSIVASDPEIRRLAAEAEDLKEIAEVEWIKL